MTNIMSDICAVLNIDFVLIWSPLFDVDCLETFTFVNPHWVAPFAVLIRLEDPWFQVDGLMVLHTQSVMWGRLISGGARLHTSWNWCLWDFLRPVSVPVDRHTSWRPTDVNIGRSLPTGECIATDVSMGRPLPTGECISNRGQYGPALADRLIV